MSDPVLIAAQRARLEQRNAQVGMRSVGLVVLPAVIAERLLDHLARRTGAYQMVRTEFRAVPIDPFGQVALHVVVGHQSRALIFCSISSFLHERVRGPSRFRKNRPPYERPGIGPLLLLGGETEFRETGSNEDVEPREALLHVETCTLSRSYSGSTSAKKALSFSGSLLGADGLLPARMGVEAGEHLGERNVVALGEHRNLRRGRSHGRSPRRSCAGRRAATRRSRRAWTAPHIYKVRAAPKWPRISFSSIIV